MHDRRRPAPPAPAPLVSDRDTPPLADRRARAALHPVERAARFLLAALDRLDVPYVVLRGDRELPRLGAAPLEVAVAHHHVARVARLLGRAAARYGARVVAHRRRGAVQQHFVHGVDPARTHRVVQVDLRTAETVGGVPYLPARTLLSGRSRRRGHARPDALVSAVVDLVDPLVTSGAVHGETLSRLATVLEQRPAQTRALLGRLFGTALADELAGGLRGAERTRLFRLARRARRALLTRAALRAPARAAAGALRERIAGPIGRFLRPEGRVVALLGARSTEGAAFTTALRRALSALLPGAELVELCPPPPGGAVRQALHWAQVVAPRRRRRALVLLDTSLEEGALDAEGPNELARRVLASPWARLAPRPDVTLVCVSEGAVRGRSDTAHRGAAQQLTAAERLAQGRRDVHLVPLGGPLEVAVDHALCALFGARDPRRRGTDARAEAARPASARRAA